MDFLLIKKDRHQQKNLITEYSTAFEVFEKEAK